MDLLGLSSDSNSSTDDFSEKKIRFLENQVQQMKQELEFFSDAMKALDSKLVNLEEQNEMHIRMQTTSDCGSFFEVSLSHDREEFISDASRPRATSSPEGLRSHSGFDFETNPTPNPQDFVSYGHMTKRALVASIQQDIAARRLKRLEIPR